MFEERSVGWVLALVLCSITVTVGTVATSGTSSATTSSIKTVFVVVMENHNWSSIAGNTSEAPYLNSLISGSNDAQTSYASQYYNPPNNHPSLPNYLWLEAGTNCFSDTGCITDDNPPSSHATSSTAHLVDLLQTAGISWKGYMESMPLTSPPSCPLTDSYPYAVRHDPFAYFNDVTNNRSSSSTECTSHVVPYSQFAGDLQNNTIARYNFITPNVCHDMHDSCSPTNDPIKQGDTWLSTAVPAILNSSAYQNGGVLFITWDEAQTGDGPIGMIALSPAAKGHGYNNAIHYTHSSLLRSIEEIFGVGPFLGDAANATDLSDLFAVPLSPSATMTTTPIVKNTSTVTPMATATGTLGPTSTAPVTPTITPTSATAPTPSSTVTSGSTLYTDTFEGDAIGTVPSGWSVYGVNAGFSVQQQGTHVYNHNGWTALSTAGSPSWTDYSYSVNVDPNDWASEADGVLFRVKDSNNYYWARYSDGTTLAITRVVNGTTTTVASKALTMTASSWHTIRIDLQGSNITVFVDGSQELATSDATFPSGAIGLAANSPVQFDNVLVTG